MKKTYLFLLAAFLLAACNSSENNTPQELKGISINKKSIQIEEGDTYQLRIWYEPDEAEYTAPEVVWESSKEKVAKVSDSGKVTAVSIGTATITATCGKFTAECEVEVIEWTAPAYLLNISPTSISSLAKGGDYTIDVTTEDEAPWTVKSLISWASVAPKSGKGSQQVTVTIQPSKETQEISGEIVFTCDKKQYTVSVTRSAYMPAFSVSATKQVNFAPGNLRYQASTDTWSFAENQYDIVGDDNQNIASGYSGWIDLFGWGTGELPLMKSGNAADYPTTFLEWGANPISNGGNQPNQWRTMSQGEWEYLISDRISAASLHGKGKVNGVEGCIFLPDNWTLPAGVSFTSKDYSWSDNQYSTAEWKKMESNGAVFLPNAGTRGIAGNGSVIIYNVNNSYGRYWTSTQSSTSGKAQYIDFGSDLSYGLSTTNERDKSYGLAVRLVQDCQ